MSKQVKPVRIATVTLNPAFDLIGRVAQLELGQVNTIQTLGLYPAGKGINVAKVLASWRDLAATSHPLFNPLQTNLAQVAVTGLLGEDNRAAFDADFAKYKLENHFVAVPGATRINVKVTTDQEVSDFNFSGFNVTPEQWEDFRHQSLALLAGFDYVAVCGSLPKGVNLEQFTAWLKDLKALGGSLFVDSSLDGLRAALLAGANFVKPNEHELGQLVGKKFAADADFEQILATAAQLQDQHGIEHLVISLGAAGSVWLQKSAAGRNVLRAQPKRVEQVVSTVGAGDSMVAGFLLGLAQGLEPEQVISVASAISTHAVTIENVGFTSWQELQAHAQPTLTWLAKA